MEAFNRLLENLSLRIKITMPIINDEINILIKSFIIFLPFRRPIFLRKKIKSNAKLKAPDNAVDNARPPTLKGLINNIFKIILKISAVTAILTGVRVSFSE